MTLYCVKCGLVIEEERSKRYYCPLCEKYTDFIEFESESTPSQKKAIA